MNQSFGIDKGIYDFDTINKFDEIQVFTGERESILSTITQNLRRMAPTKKEKSLMDRLISKMLFQVFLGTR